MARGSRIAATSNLDRADHLADLTGPQDFSAQGHNPGRLGGTLGGFGQRLPESVVVAALLAMTLRPEDQTCGRVEVRHHSSCPTVMVWTPPMASACQDGGVDHLRRRPWGRLTRSD